MLEITTGVSVDLACSSRYARSNSITVSPALTSWPSSAIRVKPWPLSSTVSIPKWTKSSMPSLDSIEKAWLVSKILPIVPFKLYRKTLMPRLKNMTPKIRWENVPLCVWTMRKLQNFKFQISNLTMEWKNCESMSWAKRMKTVRLLLNVNRLFCCKLL